MSRADAGRIIHIAKRRERAREDAELRLQQLEEERKNLGAGITTKFTANYDAIEENLKSKTIGLVTLDEMREKQKDAVVQREIQIATDAQAQNDSAKPSSSALKEEKVATQKRVLSFAYDDEEEEEDDGPFGQSTAAPAFKKRVGMDPTVDTSFLPDREREDKLSQLKEKLADEWKALQEKEKNEDINVAYSYWDGSSHRKDMKMKKGNTISQFLAKAIEVLKKEFTELKTATTESLMFVKEDLIIPHFYTFQDFIATKAVGKTGPLWQFDAAGEIRVRQDAALDCGEAHPAKVVLRNSTTSEGGGVEKRIVSVGAMNHGNEAPPPAENGTKANLDEQVGFLEFIRTSDKIVESEVKKSPKKPPTPSKKLKDGQKKSSDSLGKEATNPERKMSGEAASSLVPKSTLRMKAFKNCHKATFHSLDYPDLELNASSSTESTNSFESISGDLLQMPNFDTLQLSDSKKTHSDPTLRRGPHASRGSKSAPSNSSKPQTQRVLHTIERSDGSVVGFVTEEPVVE